MLWAMLLISTTAIVFSIYNHNETVKIKRYLRNAKDTRITQVSDTGKISVVRDFSNEESLSHSHSKSNSINYRGTEYSENTLKSDDY